MSACPVCSHPDLAKITAHLASGESSSLVAFMYGLEPTAIDEHQHHPAKPPPAPVAAAPKARVSRCVCSIGTRNDAALINAALRTTSVRKVAAAYSIAKSAVDRHRRGCLGIVGGDDAVPAPDGTMSPPTETAGNQGEIDAATGADQGHGGSRNASNVDGVANEDEGVPLLIQSQSRARVEKSTSAALVAQRDMTARGVTLRDPLENADGTRVPEASHRVPRSPPDDLGDDATEDEEDGRVDDFEPVPLTPGRVSAPAAKGDLGPFVHDPDSPFPTLPDTRQERVTAIMRMMNDLQWVSHGKGRTGRRLAAYWKLSRYTVEGYSSEASRNIKRDVDPSLARSMIGGALRRGVEVAEQTGDVKGLATVATAYANVLGITQTGTSVSVNVLADPTVQSMLRVYRAYLDAVHPGASDGCAAAFTAFTSGGATALKDFLEAEMRRVELQAGDDDAIIVEARLGEGDAVEPDAPDDDDAADEDDDDPADE